MAKIVDGRVIFDESDFGGITLWGIDFKAPYQKLFKWAYRRHDLQYQFFKNSTDVNARLKVDKELLEDMLSICYFKDKKYLIPYCHIVYFFVRNLGRFPWDKKDNAL